MRIVKKSIILYILALVAFLEALYFLKEDNLTAGIIMAGLTVLCCIAGNIIQTQTLKNEMLIAMKKNFEEEKAQLRETIQKQEKEIDVLQDSLAEHMLKSTQIREKGGPAADEKEEWLNLVTEAENAAEKYRPFAEILGVRIQVTASEERIIVKAAKNNIRKIFGNIIENSLKYMHSEGVIVITLSHIENQTLIVIKDNGRGCGKEKTEKIFEKFYQGEEGQSGSGMGLFVVKELVEQKDGTIYAKSEKGKGMAIYIELPETE